MRKFCLILFAIMILGGMKEPMNVLAETSVNMHASDER